MLDFSELLDGPTIRELTGPLPEVPADLAPAAGVRRLDGRRMRTFAGVFDECAAALQFPDWFGRNLDALEECLRDIDLPEAPGGAVVLVVTHADQLLADEPAKRSVFTEIVSDAAQVRRARGVGQLVAGFLAGGDAERLR